MKKYFAFLGLYLLTSVFLPAQSSSREAQFMSYPDIHGERLVFTWEDDLWIGTTDGGHARRITTHPGTEIMARFSPDGKWIAFSATYHQIQDLYVIPSEGGIPKRLTYFPSPVWCVGWTPDSQKVVFRSRYAVSPVSRDTRLFQVALNGGIPEPLPVDRGVSCSFSEDGKRMMYVRKGLEDYYWKRYKGGRYTDIWMADFTQKTYAPVTDYVGKNAYPLWIGDLLYFGSDRGKDGITNLYSLNLKNKELHQITRHTDFDVLWPSTDRKNIVYIQNGSLFVLDPKKGNAKKISFILTSDEWKVQPRWIHPSPYIQDTDVGNDGKNILLTARGDLYYLQLRDQETRTRDLTPSCASRERYGRISPDGKTVAFFSDRSGEYQLYLQDVSGGEWRPLTENLDRTMYHLEWSPDGKKILFGSKDFDLLVVEVADKKTVKIEGKRFLDNDEFVWEVSDYAWSPDSRWIAYSLPGENRNNTIWLYDTQKNEKTQLTDEFYENMNPRWDAAGGYLYFLSYRNFQITMDMFEDNHIVGHPVQVMAVSLREGQKPLYAKNPARIGKNQESSQEGEKKAEPAEGERYRIDIDGIRKRIYALSVPAGNYFHLLAGKNYVGWYSVDRYTEQEYEDMNVLQGDTKWNFHLYSMKEEKEIRLEEKIAGARVSVNGEHLLIQKGKAISVISTQEAYQTKKTGKPVDLSGMNYLVVPQEEWLQIFQDAWRWYRDFFYDAEMHGRDWKAIGEKFQSVLKSIRSREQLNWLLSEMVGELCVSHTYVSGGETYPPVSQEQVKFTGLLGADLVADTSSGLYRFDRIYGPTAYFSQVETPLVRPDIRLREGDYLLAINGREIKAGENYYRDLQVGKEEYIQITVNGRPDKEGALTYEVKPIRSDRSARYARWVSDNIDKVAAASNGKMGYMHITAMGGDGIMQFDKFWRAFRYKDGIIIDVRGNGGGWTEYFLIDKLERRQVAYNVLKGMEPYRYPNSASRAHYVLISNEDNGSDGEAFVEHFKARKLGTVVGVPSWGGLVGIVNAQRTVDNGIVQQSNNAFFGREGKWLVENHGADPDILQDNDPASVLSGRDLQLEKAIETVKRKITEEPWSFPQRPAYPKR